MATENEIIDQAFYLLEKDSDAWDTTDSEYTTARGFMNLGVQRWEHYDNTTWRELWTDLSSASTGQDTVSASVFTYDCPTDFVRPGGYVTTTDSEGGVTFWNVVQPEQVGKLANSASNFVYFKGNKRSGYDLQFNPLSTPTTGSTINYPYYKSATQSSATSTVLELGDPAYLSYFIAAHMSESTDSVENTFFTISEGMLKQMKSKNNAGIWGVQSSIEPDLESFGGFGTGDIGYATSSNPTAR